MPRRIIISFRGAVPSTAADGARHIAQALAMKKRAEALGANLCAWSALTFAFSFEPDELEEALRLAAIVFEERRRAEGDSQPPGRDGGGPQTPGPAALSVGITGGDLAPIGERGGLYGLAWGMPLVRASQLSRTARPGEVLVDEVFVLDRGDEFEALGFRAEGEPVKRLVPIHEIISSRPAPPPAALVLELDAEGPAPLLPAPSVPPPPPASRSSFPSFPELAPPSSLRGPSSIRPLDPHVETAKRALLQGDTVALERLIAELRETGERADLVERMSGFVALRRGATADALRRLRAAAEATQDPRHRARARLAYAVALAGAGRAESALLEALDALARAREAGDSHGEHACSLFLARLSSVSGQADAASVWAMIAARAEAADAAQIG